jgi:hypothetical protein
VDDPQIVACAFIDGGAHGSGVTGPIVLRMFQHYFNAKGGNAGVGRTAD